MSANIRISYAIAAGFILAGCAGTAPHAKSGGERSVAAARVPACLTDTGTRTSTLCAGYGRSYTHDDITRTGESQIGDALQRLDPTITAHRR